MSAQSTSGGGCTYPCFLKCPKEPGAMKAESVSQGSSLLMRAGLGCSGSSRCFPASLLGEQPTALGSDAELSAAPPRAPSEGLSSVWPSQ